MHVSPGGPSSYRNTGILERKVQHRSGCLIQSPSQFPDYLLSDQGPQFVSSIVKGTCEKWSPKQKMTAAFHPKTNLTERINRTLKTKIASYVRENHKHWDKHLPEFCFALNSAIHKSTGVTPAELNLGWPLQGPVDALLQPRDATPDSSRYKTVTKLQDLTDLVQNNLIKSRERQKQNYDKTHRDQQLYEKDGVWLCSHPYSKAEK